MTSAEATGPLLEVVRGARAGLRFPLAGEVVTVGRGSECHLRLDPDADLQASGRHAAFLMRGGNWCVCDLGSRNGTFVNGLPVAAEQALGDGDVVTLGSGGPAVVFHAALQQSTPAPPAPAARTRLVVALAALLGLVVLGVAAFLYADRREQRSWERERARLQLAVDSLRTESERTESRLRGEANGLTQALQGSRVQVEQLRAQLAQASSSRDRGAGVARQLEAAGKILHGQQIAASLDFSAIQRANRRATAVIYVEYDDGTVATATAFAVQSEGVLLTNRHAVLGADGRRRPRRIAIQFCDSEQVFPARLLATADAADLAAVAVEKLEGTVPVVRGLNLRADTLPAQAPVALIGFPLGGDEPLPARGGGAAVVRPIVGAGVVRVLRPDRMELTGYGAEGASGSPVFDRAGEVVGVLYGGTEDAAGQTLYAVPAAMAARLLDVLRRRGSS